MTKFYFCEYVKLIFKPIPKRKDMKKYFILSIVFLTRCVYKKPTGLKTNYNGDR